jgi:Holliday junction DNA helicase RuvB
VGLTTLASATGEEADSLEDVYEPYLLQNGLIERTPKGRVATPRAWEHLGTPLPKSVIEEQTPLFTEE